MNSVKRSIASAPTLRPASAGWGILAGFSASLVGIGLARFAYTPLLPAIVGAQWFEPPQGGLSGGRKPGRVPGRGDFRPFHGGENLHVFTLRAMMLLASLAFFACAWPVPSRGSLPGDSFPGSPAGR